jgi:hypothetical protein
MKRTIKIMAMLLFVAAMGAMMSCKDDDKEDEISSAEARAYAAAAVGSYDGYLDISYTFNGEEYNNRYEGNGILLTNPGGQRIAITVPDVNGIDVTVTGKFNNDGTITPDKITLAEQNFEATIQSSTLSYNKESQVLSGNVSMEMKDLNQNVTASAVATIYGQKQVQ